MPEIAIHVENLSKQYRLGQIGSGTLRDDVNRLIAKIKGREDPTLKIGQANVLNKKETSIGGATEYVWALRDINFEVRRGEVLGIIGKNGAGKSTLLKILSKVTSPTTGIVKVNGRIASLLEVGTGFHPELSGRENIFLNGAILGMTKAEITSKFDEIVDFSGVEKYIDTPVKRYSSGMYVRLAFAVAAHLEPEILVVDEVLAVGDAEFQKKAIGKMRDVSQGEGRTVLFVSHNMTAVENLCNKITVIENGRISFTGNTFEGIRHYLNSTHSSVEEELSEQLKKLPPSDEFRLINCGMTQDELKDEFLSSKSIEFWFEYEVKKSLLGLRIGFDLLDYSTGLVLFRSFHDENLEQIEEIKPGKYCSRAIIPAKILKAGSYILQVSIGLHMIRWYVYNSVKMKFSVLNISSINKNYADPRPGIIMPYVDWKTAPMQ